MSAGPPDEKFAATILVVDDTADVRALLRPLLQRAGYTVLESESGDDALVKVAEMMGGERLPDLIVLDVMMPGKDGFAVARQLRSWKETRDIPILMLTALSDVEHKVRGIDAGADDFLSKPVNNAELQSRIRSLLRAKFYRQQIVEKNSLLERILTRWQSPEVVQQILADSSRLRLGGVRSQVTVLFADLAGFTPFSERRSPEAVMEVLNHAFSRLTEIVFKYNGTLDKFIGDCVMAFYGAPIATGHDALDAVRSALEMRTVFNELRGPVEGRRGRPGAGHRHQQRRGDRGQRGLRPAHGVHGDRGHRERGGPASRQGRGRPDPDRRGHLRADPGRGRRPAGAPHAQGHRAEGA